MSYDIINQFSFEAVQYGDFKDRTLSSARFTDELTKKRCDYARTGLVVWHPPGTHIPRYRWEHREIWFHTNNEAQVLDIVIQSPQSMSDNRPRFHLHSVDSNEPEWILLVEHKQQASDDWMGLDEITDDVLPHTRFMRLHLRLPAWDIRTSFKLSVYTRDRVFLTRKSTATHWSAMTRQGREGLPDTRLRRRAVDCIAVLMTFKLEPLVYKNSF